MLVEKSLARPRVGLDQQRQALDLGEAARVEQHGPVQRLEVGLLVGDASRPRPRASSPGAARPGGGASGSGDRPRAARSRGRSRWERRRSDRGRGRARPRPAVCPRGPLTTSRSQSAAQSHIRIAQRSACVQLGRGAGGDPLQHQQLGAVHVTEHRDLRELARRRLVERAQVVQVEEVRRRRRRPAAAPGPRPRPGARRPRRRETPGPGPRPRDDPRRSRASARSRRGRRSASGPRCAAPG